MSPWLEDDPQNMTELSSAKDFINCALKKDYPNNRLQIVLELPNRLMQVGNEALQLYALLTWSN
ncbi:hypothetical protein MNBD_ALPHA05-36 [hydrothermal vent metagenome]|uniref:Uncharacterized protein n=1 Tax=hydrothermal vent metagenome TaxID=652676 RepID=A0A3B0SHI7_9ZZZZ